MKGRGDERSRESARVPKAVHCAIQSKGKESKVLLNYTPSVPLPNSDHQIAGTDIDDGLVIKRYF
ncbi:hypothetical protein CFP56_020856 [Quercus suber]|uniref:Uncharacterized protein n=1 Tax=Quercus suber TaxID=58331 RepID=A0AAW0KG51_QUESU